MPVWMDIEVPRNGDWIRRTQMLDDTGQPIDLTGTALKAVARRLAGDVGTPIAEAQIELEPDSLGFFNETWRGSDFEGVEGRFEAVRLAYDLSHTHADGLVTIERRGHIILTPGVTYV